MRFVAIKKLTYFLGSQDIDTFHYSCYHGFFRGKKYLRNAADADAWSMPDLDFIGPASMKDLLEGVSGFSVRPMLNVSWFSQPYEIGDFSHWDIEGFSDDGTSLENYLKRKVVDYSAECFLLMALNISELEGAREASASVNLGPTEWDPVEIISIPRHLLIPRSVFQFGAVLCFSEDIFEVIEPHLKRPFFLKQVVDFV